MNFSRRQVIVAIVIVAVLAILVARCSPDGRNMKAPGLDKNQSIAVPTTIAASIETSSGSGFTVTGFWIEGEEIGTKYTCKGESISPPLQLGGVPTGAVTLGLVLTDLDANGVIHWAVANIAATDTNIVEGTVPSGAIQATTAQGSVGYWAPCPPAGQTHHYVLTAYALAQQLEFADGVDSETLQAALEAGALAVAESSFIAQTP